MPGSTHPPQLLHHDSLAADLVQIELIPCGRLGRFRVRCLDRTEDFPLLRSRTTRQRRLRLASFAGVSLEEARRRGRPLKLGHAGRTSRNCPGGDHANVNRPSTIVWQPLSARSPRGQPTPVEQLTYAQIAERAEFVRPSRTILSWTSRQFNGRQ
jgi:hypothetical protein